MAENEQPTYDHEGGTAAPWYRGWELTDERREFFRERSRRSHAAKVRALAGNGPAPAHALNTPRLSPIGLMPQIERHELVALSLFSGGGGLDLGFDRAGYVHAASYDTLEAAGRTLAVNRPGWSVHSGADGDVRGVDWGSLRGGVDVLHGGPPCQPFSAAGRQRGRSDERNMLPEFVRAVRGLRPRAFVAENVPALAAPKFAEYLQASFHEPLGDLYGITTFQLRAHEFGVPQVRRRVFLVGLRDSRDRARFRPPSPTHRADDLPGVSAATFEEVDKRRTLGAREALGLSAVAYDALAPTMRSTLTGPRHTTSILSSASAQKAWARLKIWPNGVAPTREAARAFVPENGHFRLAVADCAVLQGFPPDWSFDGPVYMALGQIGNSVAPPVAYRVAKSVLDALRD